MRRIKLFEGFSEEYEIDKVYDQWYLKNKSILESLSFTINENEEEDWADETGLNPAEERALSRDLQIITKSQLAALYLKALGQYEFGNRERLRKRRSRSELIAEDVYVTNIPGIEFFASGDGREGTLFIGPSALADAIGLESLGTVTRTVNKFRLLLNGETTGREDEIVYPKVIRAFDYLKKQNVDAIKSMAAECIQDPETSNKHRSLLKSSGVTREDSFMLGNAVHLLFKDYYANKFFKKDVCKIQRIAINKISELKRTSTEELKKHYKEFLIKEKMLNKYNWCDIFAKSDYGVY